MKPGIVIIGLVGLALAVVGLQDSPAQAEHSTTRLSGSSFIISTLADGTIKEIPPFASVQSGIAKGGFGSAVFRSQTSAGELGPAAPGECPDGFPVKGPLTATFVLTYDDGSILSGVTGLDNFYCADLTGDVFVADFGGIITGGDGRFEGATGFWEAAAEVDGARITGEIEIDLD
jgi:hypothetical protein